MRPAIKHRSNPRTMPTRALPKSRRDLGDLLLDKSAKALPIWLVAGKDDAHLKELTDAQRTWLEARGCRDVRYEFSKFSIPSGEDFSDGESSD